MTGVVSPGPAPPPSSEKKNGKAKKTLADIRGFCDLPASTTATIATGGMGKKKGKPIEAKIHLAVHQKNDKVGQLTGRAMYIVNPVYDVDDNAAFKQLMSDKFYQNPRYFKDLGCGRSARRARNWR